MYVSQTKGAVRHVYKSRTTDDMTLEEFIDCVLPWQRLMFAVAVRMGLSSDDASDAVQEAMVKLWRLRSRLDDVADIRSYCLAALRNECISSIRRRRDTAPIDAAAGALAAPGSGAEGAADDIAALMERLPENQRAVIKMRCMADMDFDEISAATGYSQANVRQLLSRARKNLRKLFGP